MCEKRRILKRPLCMSLGAFRVSFDKVAVMATNLCGYYVRRSQAKLRPKKLHQSPVYAVSINEYCVVRFNTF